MNCIHIVVQPSIHRALCILQNWNSISIHNSSLGLIYFFFFLIKGDKLTGWVTAATKIHVSEKSAQLSLSPTQKTIYLQNPLKGVRPYIFSSQIGDTAPDPSLNHWVEQCQCHESQHTWECPFQAQMEANNLSEIHKERKWRKDRLHSWVQGPSSFRVSPCEPKVKWYSAK